MPGLCGIWPSSSSPGGGRAGAVRQARQRGCGSSRRPARRSHGWREGSSSVQQQALRDFGKAMAAFFDPQHPAGKPSYRSRRGTQGFVIRRREGPPPEPQPRCGARPETRHLRRPESTPHSNAASAATSHRPAARAKRCSGALPAAMKTTRTLTPRRTFLPGDWPVWRSLRRPRDHGAYARARRRSTPARREPPETPHERLRGIPALHFRTGRMSNLAWIAPLGELAAGHGVAPARRAADAPATRP